MGELKIKKSNIAFPATQPTGDTELAKLVKETEKGPFYTSAQVKNMLKKWSQKHSR